MHTITTNISRTAPLWRKPTSFNLTPLGTAERFVYEHGNNIRYCQPWGQWLVWNGQRWCRDESSEVHRLAVETVRSIRKHAKSVSDEDLRAKMEVHTRRCETSNSLDGILSLAEKQAGIPILPGEFDRDGMLFNCPNGTIDLRTGLLRDKLRRRYRPIDEAEGFDASDDIGAVAIGAPVGNQEGAIGQLYNGIIRPIAAEDGRVVAGTAVDNIVASAAG